VANSVAFVFKSVGLEQISAKMGALNGKLDQTKSRLRGVSAASLDASRKLKTMAGNMRGLSVAATGASVASLKAFADLDAGIVNTLNLLSSEEIDQWGGRIEAATKQSIGLGFGIEDANAGLWNMISNLGASEQSMKAFDAAQKLAIGGNASLASSVTGISKVMNAYGKETTDAMEVANAFFTAQKFGSASVEQMTSNIGKIAPTTARLKIPVNEMMATFAQLTIKSDSAEEAATQLLNTLKVLETVKAGSAQAKQFRRLGIETGASAIQQKGLATILGQVANAINTDADALSRLIPEARAMRGIASLNAEALEKIRSIQDQINQDNKRATGLQEAVNRNMATFSRKMKIAFGEVKLLASSIGKDLAPVVESLADGLHVITERYRNLSPGMRKMIAMSIMLAAVTAPILTVLSGIAFVVGTITPAIAAAALAFGALAAAVAQLVIHWETLTNTDMAEFIGDVVGFTAEVGSKLIDPLGLTGQDAKGVEMSNSISSALTGVGGFFKDMFSGEKSQTDVNVNLRSQQGQIESVQTKTTGKVSGLNVGTNMQTQ
jgi:TP901 family phage tail tape measure protein